MTATRRFAKEFIEALEIWSHLSSREEIRGCLAF